MKKVKIIAAVAIVVASAFYHAQAGCENTGTPTGNCQTEYGSTTGTLLCYTTSGGGNCTGSVFNYNEE